MTHEQLGTKGDANAYTQSWVRDGVVNHYLNKFRNKQNIVRHTIEVQYIKPFVRGNLFDCSIATGRFIPEFTGVSSYKGMDYSPDFLEFMQKNFPQIPVKRGDLLKGIEEPDNSYDTTMCMRTLFALPQTEEIISEMIRITKPGGTVIFDYGRTTFVADCRGQAMRTSPVNLREFLAKNPTVELLATYRLDSPIVLFFIKWLLPKKFFNSQLNLLPASFWIKLERAVVHLWCQRLLFIVKKK